MGSEMCIRDSWTTVSTVTMFAVFAVDAKLKLGDSAVLATAPLMASYAGHQLLAWAMMIDMFPDPPGDSSHRR